MRVPGLNGVVGAAVVMRDAMARSSNWTVAPVPRPSSISTTCRSSWRVSASVRRPGCGRRRSRIVLYHLANLAHFTTGYSDTDVVQTILFVVVGIVTAKLSEDARRLRQLAATDDLTGLHNLRSFEARLVRLVRTSRETGTPLAMLVLDVDRLKSINDTYGHLAGRRSGSPRRSHTSLPVCRPTPSPAATAATSSPSRIPDCGRAGAEDSRRNCEARCSPRAGARRQSLRGRNAVDQRRLRLSGRRQLVDTRLTQGHGERGPFRSAWRPPGPRDDAGSEQVVRRRRLRLCTSPSNRAAIASARLRLLPDVSRRGAPAS